MAFVPSPIRSARCSHRAQEVAKIRAATATALRRWLPGRDVCSFRVARGAMGGHNLGMKIRLIAVLLSVVAMSAVAAPPKKELETRLDAYVAPLIEQNVFSGVVLLAKGDEVLLH